MDQQYDEGEEPCRAAYRVESIPFVEQGGGTGGRLIEAGIGQLPVSWIDDDQRVRNDEAKEQPRDQHGCSPPLEPRTQGR